MWERFEAFADDFVIRAQARYMEHNAKRADDGETPEIFVSKLRTEFARPTGPTSTGSVLVLFKSTYVPVSGVPIPPNLGCDEVDELAWIDSFDEVAAHRPCRTWWLTFLPQPGPDDGWSFDHADAEDESGCRVRATDTAWIDALMPMRRDKRKTMSSDVIEFEVDSNPMWRNAHFGVRDRLDFRAGHYANMAKKGFAMAQVLIGTTHSRERGVSSDDAKALHWYTCAARQGQAAALILLARMYARGEGVALDRGRALGFFHRAAAQGKARARCMLGDFFECGMGMPEDAQRAIQCYIADAEQGYAPSEYRLARLYEIGAGVEKDAKAAWNWYARSVRHGNKMALLEMDVLALRTAERLPALVWPGEQRTRTAIWLERRRSRPSEREAAETALMVAETCDAVIARGTLAADQVHVFVEAGNSTSELVVDPIPRLVRVMQAAGVDVSPILIALSKSRMVNARLVALKSLDQGDMPRALVDDLLIAGLGDKSGEVSAKAAEIAATCYRKKWLIPAMAAAALRHPPVRMYLELLRDGYCLIKMNDGMYNLRVLTAKAGILEPTNGTTFSVEELTKHGIETLIAQMRIDAGPELDYRNGKPLSPIPVEEHRVLDG